MNFNEYMRRPVYVAQCKTWRKASELNLCGLGIRSLPSRRDAYSQAARDIIALAMKMDRAREHLAK